MPTAPHIERHFLSSAIVRDIVIGMADGLTVPFALAAGLSGAVSSAAIIVTAGLAEIAAGAIAMGLGGYLAARTDLEHYESELRREIDEIAQVPETERSEVQHILREHGLAAPLAETVAAAITSDHQRWLDFMMRFELGLDKPEAGREFKSAVTISGAYIAGGLLPLAPYFLLDSVSRALPVSVALTMAALLVFGAIKGHFTGLVPLRSALQTAIVGTFAAAAAFAIARLVSS
jgi:VIT1/CCC1 family predicted Fe2+/Mn2+ transporter